MPRIHRPALALLLPTGVSLTILACSSAPPPPPERPGLAPVRSTLPPSDPLSLQGAPPVRDVLIAADPARPRPPYAFSPDDERFLDEVQRGSFNWLWYAADPVSGMIPDRHSKPDVVSVAGVGFQLSGIIVGVERGWISREAGEERARRILSTLLSNPNNRKAGLFYHFVDSKTAGQPSQAYEHVVSTIDSALLFAGVITVSTYFGGEVAQLADRMVADADWSFFVGAGDVPRPYYRGFISLGWKPDDRARPTGHGRLLPHYWIDAGDEHRLVTFLAVAAPNPEHAIPARRYYELRRQLGHHAPTTGPFANQSTGPFVWFPWSGALFVSFFAHCWIDHAALGPDDPAAFGVDLRPRVDWWENARRTTLMHRWKAIENPTNTPTLGQDFWGLSASDVATGYAVPGLFPDPLPMPGARAPFDFADATVRDDFGDGTIAPYSAAAAILFDPQASLSSLRAIRALQAPDGSPLVWTGHRRDPSDDPRPLQGYGFRDSFNLGTGWVAPDFVAIDQGPMLLAIENARTGLIWNAFHAHPVVQQGLQRLNLQRRRPGP